MRKRRHLYLLEKEKDAAWAQGVKFAGQLYQMGREQGGIVGVENDGTDSRANDVSAPSPTNLAGGQFG